MLVVMNNQKFTSVNEIEQKYLSQINLLNSEIASLKQRVETLESQTKPVGAKLSYEDMNQIILNSFGADDISFLTREQVRKICSSPYDSDKVLLSYIEAVNCNKSIPENHNFLITSLQSNSAEVYQDGLWVTVDKKKSLKMFFEHKVRELGKNEELKNLQTYLPCKVMLTDWNYEALMDEALMAERLLAERSLAGILKKIERLIYSHREMIKETKRRSNNNNCSKEVESSSNVGLVYLIQPEELVGTNRYKVGCSQKTNIDRLKNYKKNSQLLCSYKCINPFEVENKLKAAFSAKFPLIAGSEYFQGREEDLLQEFLNTVQKAVTTS